MKKKILLFVPLLILTSCTYSNETSNFDKASNALKDFNILNYSGYDYSHSQKLDNKILNDKQVAMRIKNVESSYIGEKTVNNKSLSHFDPNQIYNQEVFTTYYQDGFMISYQDEKWGKTAISQEQYFACNLDFINLKSTAFKDAKEYVTTDSYIIKADIPNELVKDCFNVDINNISDFKCSFSFTNDIAKLNDFKLQFTQNNYYNEIAFKVFNGEVNINVPNVL